MSSARLFRLPGISRVGMREGTGGGKQRKRGREDKTFLSGGEARTVWTRQLAPRPDSSPGQKAGLREGTRGGPESRDPRPCYSHVLLAQDLGSHKPRHSPSALS